MRIPINRSILNSVLQAEENGVRWKHGVTGRKESTKWTLTVQNKMTSIESINSQQI